MGNYVQFVEDSNGDKILIVEDYMGLTTTTTYRADGTETTTKTDETGAEVREGYYDDEGSYVMVKVDPALGVDVKIVTDHYGYRREEYNDTTGTLVVREFDPTGFEIIRLPTATGPQNFQVGANMSGFHYHLTWEAPADDGGYPIMEYIVYWDDYSDGYWWSPIAWLMNEPDSDGNPPVLELHQESWDPFMPM